MVLDWDGKPIPYWLYRLHGLNHTFTCEICGDHIYRGPKVGLAAIVFITSFFSFATLPAREIAGTFDFSNCKYRPAFRPLRSTLQSGVTRTVCVVWAFPTPNTLRTLRRLTMPRRSGRSCKIQRCALASCFAQPRSRPVLCVCESIRSRLSHPLNATYPRPTTRNRNDFRPTTRKNLRTAWATWSTRKRTRTSSVKVYCKLWRRRGRL